MQQKKLHPVALCYLRQEVMFLPRVCFVCLIELISLIMQIFNIHKQAEFNNRITTGENIIHFIQGIQETRKCSNTEKSVEKRGNIRVFKIKCVLSDNY